MAQVHSSDVDLSFNVALVGLVWDQNAQIDEFKANLIKILKICIIFSVINQV